MATGRPVRRVGAAKNGGHAAARGHAFNAVVIELFAGVDGSHGRWRERRKDEATGPVTYCFMMPENRSTRDKEFIKSS